MKRLLVLVSCCFSFSILRAQNPAPRVFEIKPGTALRFKDGKYFIKPLNDTTIVFNDLVFSKHSGGHFYHPAIDHMPIIVPDTKEIVPIPNLWKGEIKVPYQSRPPRIPNAAPLQGFQYRTK